MQTFIDRFLKNEHLRSDAINDAAMAAHHAGNNAEAVALTRLRFRFVDVVVRARIHRDRMRRRAEAATTAGCDLSPEWRRFVSSMTPMQQAKATAATRGHVRRNGKVQTRHDLVLSLAADGWKPGNLRGREIAEAPDGGFLDAGQITATAIRFLRSIVEPEKVP